MRDLRVKVCKPVIRGLHTKPSLFSIGGKWQWAARCIEHDTSWTTGGQAKWSDALAAAQNHQREWAEMASA